MSDKPAVAGASVGVVTALFAALTGFGLQHLLARTDVDAFERPLSFLVAILLFLRFLTGSANHLWYEHVRESIIDPNKEFGRKEFALDLGFLTVFGCLAAFMCHASIPVCFFGFAFVLVGAAVAFQSFRAESGTRLRDVSPGRGELADYVALLASSTARTTHRTSPRMRSRWPV